MIADDLTGAADTGVQYSASFPETWLMSHEQLEAETPDSGRPAVQALAVSTDSRALDPASARERLRKVAGRLKALNPARVYKKVDSCLRGNLGAETESLMEEMGYEVSFVAPAFPEMGRTTRHGVHYVHGVPVDRTELGRDPVTPVDESRLQRVMARQSRYGAAHVDLDFLERARGLEEEIERLLRSQSGRGAGPGAGIRHLTFDAENRRHLDRIVEAAENRGRVLLVGSAGLAGSLGRRFPCPAAGEERQEAALPAGHFLLVCGTASEKTREQEAALCERQAYKKITLGPELLAGEAARDELAARSRRAADDLRAGHLIVGIDPPGTTASAAGTRSQTLPADRIADGLGLFVAWTARRTRPAGLFLTGGDTVRSVFNRLDVRGMRLCGEVVPGLVRGTLKGGELDGTAVATKAGAFGRRDTLIKLHEYWSAKERER